MCDARMFGLELLADLVLEHDVRRRGALRRVGILGLSHTLALSRLSTLLNCCNFSLAPFTGEDR